MNGEYYFIDGRRYTAQETKKIFENAVLGKREQIVLSMIDNPQDNKKIVDLGCLYGSFCHKLKETFPNSTVIAGDYTEENLKIARLIYPSCAENFRILNAYSLDLNSCSVDVVSFQEVIEHLEGAAIAIKEINRVLKINGELILTTPTAYYARDMFNFFKFEIIRGMFRKKWALSNAIFFKEHEWNRHIYCWTPITLYTLLKVNGFDYVSHSYCQTGSSLFEKFILKLFPFLSPVIIIKVKKMCEAPSRII